MRKTILSLKHRALSLLVTTVMLLGAQSAFAALTYQVIAGDRNNGDNEGLPKLFDGDYGTKWGNGYSEGTPQYFIIKVSEAVAPEWYCLVTANDTQQYSDRNWKTWKIYGANFDSDEAATREAEGWTLVDSKENIGPDQLPAANFTEAFFELSEKSTEKYLYFRLEIEACVGANPYMQMAEFFFGEEEKFNSISKSRYDAANAFEYPEYYQKNLATKYKAAVRSLRYAENIFEVAQYDKECKDLQSQIIASGDAYQNYITVVNSVVSAAEDGKLNAEGTAKVEAYKNETFPKILADGKMSADEINAEAKTVGGWVEAYSAIDLTEGYIDVTYTALSGVDGFGDAEHYSKLVDGDDYTKWCSGNGNYFIIIKASAAIVPTYYRLFTSGDTGNYPGRNWKTWQVFGGNFASDDAATREAEGWELIDDKQNSNVLPAASNTEVYVNLSNPSKTPYQYFKIEIKDPSGVMQMSELSFLNQANFYKARQDKVAEFEGVDLTQPIMESMKAEFSAALEDLRAVTTLNDLGTAASKCGNLANQIKAANELFAKTGNVVLAGSTAWGEGENWVRLVDGDLTTKWGGGRSAEGAYLIFRTKDAQAPYFYTLVTGNDTEGSPDRNWADWTIYAANFASDAEATRDAEGWTVIAQEAGIGQDRLPGANFAHAHFDFTTTPVAEAYSYFRVEVPKSFDNGGNIQMTELIFKSAEDFPAVKEEIAKGMKDQLTAMGVTNVDAFIESLSYMKAPFDKIEAAETINQVYEAKAAFDKVITSLKAPEMAGGYYQIDTPEKLQWLAGAVKMGFQNAKAKLTADLDMGGTLVEGAPAEDSKLFTPIGITDIPFTGEFDGQGHVISNLVVNTGEDYAGLFGRIAGSAIVKNFIVDAGSYIGGNAFVGVIGGSQGGNGIIIDRIGMEGKVVAAAQNAGGIYGCNMGNPSATVSNCYVTGDVIGNRESGQVNGWLGGGRIENTWAIGGIEGVYNKAEGAGDGFYRGAPTVGGVLYSNALYRNATTQPYDEEIAKSGAMTYALNGNKADGAWFQTLGEDEYPTLNATHKKVYAQPSEGFRCDGLPLGDITYTNDEVVPNIPDHEYEGYICKNCGQIDPEFAQRDGDGFYVLYDAQELSWFAAMVNSGNTTLNARLADDIDMANVAGFSPIGNQSNLYTGTFDGEFHTISNFTIEGGDYTGLFGVVGGGATIKNFVMKNASIKGNAFIGIIGGSNGGGTITIDALGFEGEAIGAAQNASAIIGVNMGSAAAFTISNCYVIGKVQGARESAAITGWTGGSQSTITNCWSKAEVSGNDAGKAFYRNDGTVWSNCFNQYGEQVDAIPEGSLADGSMTWLLNGESEEGVWKQNLGVDEYPTLNQNHLSVVKFGDKFMNKKGDALQIGSADDLAAFAEAVNAGQTNLNAALSADFDYAGPAISTLENRYKGVFDGQFHTINLNMTTADSNYGLFRNLEGTVRNLNVSGLFTAAHNRVGVIVGEIYGGLIENCWVSADIAATYNGDGAIAGICGRASGANSIIRNCVFSGNVEGIAYNCAGILGWAPNVIDIQNCLVTGEFKTDQSQGNARPIARHADDNTNAHCVNCYFVNPNGTRENTNTTKVTAEQVASGEIAVKLGAAFRQNIGEDANPVLDPTHAYVKEITEVGYATLYLPDDVEIPEGITAYVGEIVGDFLWLKALSSSVIWNDYAVVLKGAPGYYNFKPVELDLDGGVRNMLQGTHEDIQADGSQYVLAQKNGVVGFYKAEGTIAAGKAYLTGGANVKGFALSFDGETGIADAVAEKTVESNAIYDLSGRRVEKAVKGIYIINGKQVLK